MVLPENKSKSPFKDLRISTKDNVMHLVEQRGCAVLRIVSSRCNHHCQQLKRLADSFQEKRPTILREVMLCRDNARPHSANLTKNTIQELGWVDIPQPPYSPDPAPSEFYIFRSLSNNLQGTSFPDENVLRTWLDDLFNSKPRNLYRRVIRKLFQLWETVVIVKENLLLMINFSLMCI